MSTVTWIELWPGLGEHGLKVAVVEVVRIQNRWEGLANGLICQTNVPNSAWVSTHLAGCQLDVEVTLFGTNYRCLSKLRPSDGQLFRNR
jgi:hypothetical protein